MSKRPKLDIDKIDKLEDIIKFLDELKPHEAIFEIFNMQRLMIIADKKASNELKQNSVLLTILAKKYAKDSGIEVNH